MTSSDSTFTKCDSLDDFVFCDEEDDLNIDNSKSPITGAANKVSSGLSMVISALISITEEQGLVVASVPFTTIAATAVGAVTGTMLGGPPGLAIGLLTGAILGVTTSPKQTKSPKTSSPKKSCKKSTTREVFSQMTLQQKKELLKELLSCLKQPNVRVLVMEIMKNDKIRNTAVSIVSNFFLKKMGLCLSKA